MVISLIIHYGEIVPQTFTVITTTRTSNSRTTGHRSVESEERIDLFPNGDQI